jgi:hypothetical protein
LDREGGGNFLPLPLSRGVADLVGRRTWKFSRHLHPAALAIPHLTQYGRETAAIRSRIAIATLRG